MVSRLPTVSHEASPANQPEEKAVIESSTSMDTKGGEENKKHDEMMSTSDCIGKAEARLALSALLDNRHLNVLL